MKSSANQGERILPEHLAIIMDGNGRWAKKRFMPRSMGHRAGAAKFKQYLKDALEDLLNDDIKIRFLGDTSMFSADLQELIAQTIETGKTRTGMVLNLAMNYGSRAEITRAAQNLAEQVKNGTLQPSDITEQMLSDHMYTYGEPDPDLIIRPSGEYRLSNFLLWQSAYSELIFMDVLWPDFTTGDLEHCLDEYAKRNRRFGGV